MTGKPYDDLIDEFIRAANKRYLITLCMCAAGRFFAALGILPFLSLLVSFPDLGKLF